MPPKWAMFDVKTVRVEKNETDYILTAELCERQKPLIGLLNPEPVSQGVWIDHDSNEDTGMTWFQYSGIDYEIYTLANCTKLRCTIRTYLEVLISKEPVTFLIEEEQLSWVYTDKYSIRIPESLFDPNRSRLGYIMVNTFRDEISLRAGSYREKILEINDPFENIPIDLKSMRISMKNRNLIVNYTFYSHFTRLKEGGAICWLPSLSLGKALLSPIIWLTSLPPYNLTGIVFRNTDQEFPYVAYLHENSISYIIDLSKLRIKEEIVFEISPLVVCNVYDIVPDKGWLKS